MNAYSLQAKARHWLALGRPAVLVEQRSVRGSAPREAGVRMVVAADDALGTIGGGHLEWMALNTARQVLAGLAPWPEPLRVALGPALGQCCGGAVELCFEPLSDAALERWALPPARFHLCLYGAGHVGQAVVQVLTGIDCTVDWIDNREVAFDGVTDGVHMGMQSTRTVWSEDPAAEARAAPAGAHHLVMTHSHALDFDIVKALLERQGAGWVGLIGSKTKRAQFERRLVERGVAQARVAQLCCPVGLPGVTGKEPMAVAVAVVAQLLSLPSPVA